MIVKLVNKDEPPKSGPMTLYNKDNVPTVAYVDDDGNTKHVPLGGPEAASEIVKALANARPEEIPELTVRAREWVLKYSG